MGKHGKAWGKMLSISPAKSQNQAFYDPFLPGPSLPPGHAGRSLILQTSSSRCGSLSWALNLLYKLGPRWALLFIAIRRCPIET